MTARYHAPDAPKPGIAILLSLLALALMFADARLGVLAPVRQVLGGALYPVQAALAWPMQQVESFEGYFDDMETLRNDNRLLRTVLIQQAGVLAATERLRQENESLRDLAGLRLQIPQAAIVAETVMQPRNAGTRRRLLDRGSHHGVAAGQPVIDARGVIGQITRVYPFSSEMTLITDPVMSVPVSVRRNGLHALAFGTPSPALMELRFQSKEADIQIGDVLQTSGLDFLYPPGVPVGVVEDVTLPADEPFAQVTVRPLANLTDPRLVLALQPDTSAIPAQDEAAPPTRHTPQAPTPDMSSPDTSAGMSHAPSHAADAAEQNDADPTASTPGAARP